YMRKVSRRRMEVSLDEPLNVDGEGNELLLGDILGTETDGVFTSLEGQVERKLLIDGLDKLSKREKEIVFLRFGLNGKEEKTQKEVADLLGISQSYISRLEKKIIGRLKKEITKLV
ncbi:MAG: sigma-70 family RNA polymerase sigma factor, partial [Clostridia bacterium]